MPVNLLFLKKMLSGNKSAWIKPDGIFFGQFASICSKLSSIIFAKFGWITCVINLAIVYRL